MEEEPVSKVMGIGALMGGGLRVAAALGEMSCGAALGTSRPLPETTKGGRRLRETGRAELRRLKTGF